MYTDKKSKYKTLIIAAFYTLCVQVTGFALEISEGDWITVNSGQYEMILTKNGVISEITVGGETIFSNIGPFVKLEGYQGKPTLQSYDYSKYVLKKIGSAYKLHFTTIKMLYNKKKRKSEKAISHSITYLISDREIKATFTIKPFKKDKARFLFVNIDMPTKMDGSGMSKDGSVSDLSFDYSYPKYKNLGTVFKEYALMPVYMERYLKSRFKVVPGNSSYLQLGQFPYKFSIQVKSSDKSERVELSPQKSIELKFSILIPENHVEKNKKKRVTVVATKGKIVRKMNKGLFAVGSFRFGNTSSDKINNFVENEKLVKLIKDCGIPAMRFNALYTAFGIENGWTQRSPFKIDPIYPEDNGPLNLDVADVQFSAIREKLGCEMYFAMGLYNPSWMKKVPGTRWQFQKVTDFDAWGRFAGKLAEHAKKKNWNIKIWEIWNEADAKNYWEGGTREEYINFYRTVVPYIEKADPDVKISGPVYTGGHFGTGQLMDEFLNGIQGTRCDYINWHHYGSLDLIVPRINIVKKLLKKYNRENTGIFISELGVADGASGDTVKAAVWISRAWKRILYNDVDYCVLWALSGMPGQRGIIKYKTLTVTPVYYLFKMFNVIANMPQSTLITPLQMPEGMESIAVKTPDGYAFFLIKNNKINTYQVKFDYRKLDVVKSVELYSVSKDKNAQKITSFTKGKGFFEYTFHDFEILCVKINL